MSGSTPELTPIVQHQMEVELVSFIATAFGTKVAIAALSLIAIGGGAAVAADNGVLPMAASSVAETGTPPATPTNEATETATPEPAPPVSVTKGPDATGSAAFGLCTAYTAGGLKGTSVPYAALLSAAKSAGSIATYCSPILAAHKSIDRKPTPTSIAPSSNSHGQSGEEHGKNFPVSHGH